MFKRRTVGDVTFETVSVIFMIFFCITTLYPFLYLVGLSLSSADASTIGYSILPQGFSLENYAKVLENSDIGVGFKNAIIKTIIGSAVNVVGAIIAAYPLSKKYFPHRSMWTGLIVFTMFFSGGLVPSYLLVKRLGLLESMWALILPGAISTYNMIIMRNFFMSLPESLEEAARIDGANDFVVLIKVVIPTSMAIIATITLWSLVGHWNSWFDALIYITNPDKQLLQIVMRRIVLEGTVQMLNPNAADYTSKPVNSENIKAATIMITTLPIIAVYPFLQKYFVKGVMIGSLKG